MQALAQQPQPPHRRFVQARTTQTLPPRRRGGERLRQAKQRLVEEGERFFPWSYKEWKQNKVWVRAYGLRLEFRVRVRVRVDPG